ncbi:MAG: type II secretion system F family protein [Planctomycetaceae bacterium]|nr:type II secretion system F family protein [Planctomycetaceae bacterium]
MQPEMLISIAAFGAITSGVWAILTLITTRKSRASERLEELRDPMARKRQGDNAGKVNNMFEKAAPTLSKALQPKSETEQSDLKIRLANAGFASPNASRNFLAIKLIGLILGVLFGAIYGFANMGVSSNSWMAFVIGGGTGFYLPEAMLTLLKMSRQQKIFLQLPDALDLLVVCVEAGLGLDAGMRRVSEELAGGAPEVCQELATANMQLQMGKPRRDVLHDLGVRTGVDDMRALAAILIQADRFGSSIAQALRVQSDSMRTKRRQMAEEKAQGAAVKMIFPLVLFIFPGIFVILVGPAGIQLMDNLVNK